MGVLWPRLQTPTILVNLSSKRSHSFADLCSGMPSFSWCYWSQDRANRAFCCGGRTESWTDKHSALWSKLLVFLFLWGHLFCLTHTAGDWRLHAHTHKADSTCLGRHNEAHNHSHGRWDTKELYQEGLSPLHPPAHPHTHTQMSLHARKRRIMSPHTVQQPPTVATKWQRGKREDGRRH